MENKKICSECGCVIDQDNEVIEIDNEYLCQNCFEENYFECQDCGDIHNKEEGYYVDSNYGYWVCDNCYCNNYFTCEDCGEIHHLDECCNISDCYCICESCYENGNYHYCDNCNEYFSGDCHYNNDYCYCDSCYEEQGGGMLSYHEYVEWKFYKSEKDQPIIINDREYLMGIGTEIEQEPRGSYNVQGVINAINNNINAVAMEDGSLNYGGVEIITHPQTWNYFQEHKQDYVKFFEELKNLDYKNCGHCGLHFHITRPDEDTIARAIVLLESFKEEIKVLSRRSQERLNQWATFITDNCYEEDKLKYQSQKFLKEDYLQKGHSRYSALNLTNSNTIEFRFFAGVNNFEEFWSALQFIVNLMQIALNHDINLNNVKWKDLLVGEELVAFASKLGLLEINKSAKDTTEILDKLEELKLKTQEDIKKILKNMIVYVNRQMKNINLNTPTSKDVAKVQKETRELFDKMSKTYETFNYINNLYNSIDNLSASEVKDRFDIYGLHKYTRYYKQILKVVDFYKNESEVIA